MGGDCEGQDWWHRTKGGDLEGLEWVREDGIQQASEWPRTRHSWVQLSEASSTVRWTVISAAVGWKNDKINNLNVCFIIQFTIWQET